MESLIQKHLDAIIKAEYDPEDNVPNYVGFATEAAEITKEVAIEFQQWVWKSKYDKFDKFLDDIKTEVWLNRENLSEKEYTIEELFDMFLKTKQ